MPTWSGWASSVLSTVNATDTGANRTFLDNWARMDGSTCNNNPLASTRASGGSKHCKHVSGSVYVQSYPTRAHGIDGTAAQLEEATFKAILAALKSGNPYGYSDWQSVVGALGTWGAHSFAVEYAKAAQTAQPSAPPPTLITKAATQGLTGYRHLSTTLAKTVPEELRKAQRLRAQTLALLHGRR